MNRRKVYLDISSGEFHASYLGDNIQSFTKTLDLMVGDTIINHEMNTTNIIVQLIDNDNNILFPDIFEIVDENSVRINVISPQPQITVKLIFFEDTCSLFG